MLARHCHIVEKDIALRIAANTEVAFFELDIDTGLRAGNGREALR